MRTEPDILMANLTDMFWAWMESSDLMNLPGVIVIVSLFVAGLCRLGHVLLPTRKTHQG